MSEVRKARAATFVAFGGSGFAFASWASRIPQVRDQLQLEPSALGFVLLAIAVGSLVALPSAGHVVARFGSQRTVAAMALLLAVALLTSGVGSLVGLVPVVVGLFLFGFANGAWDVAMNVQGAAVERALGRSVLPRFHAGFSLGTVAGALVGAAAVALDVSVAVHLALVAVTIGSTVVWCVRGFLPDETVEEGSEIARRNPLRSWMEPRTLVIGLCVLAFAFAEGVGNDWITVAVIDGYDASPVFGTLAFAAFLAAMTTGRWFGPHLLDRFGRTTTVRTLALLALTGLLIFVFAPHVSVAFVGALLWGLGTSLGFPVGMSAAADDPKLAAGRVSVVASIGYCAFLAGPPLVGLLGDEVGVLRALTVVSVLLLLGFMAAGALRPSSFHQEMTQ